MGIGKNEILTVMVFSYGRFLLTLIQLPSFPLSMSNSS